ncbi:MAG: cobalt transporter CbiM [Bryobacteraceae bacterium]
MLRPLMHIPDGYLSPATCATLYAGAAPFWYTSLRKMRRVLHSRMVPLVSLFAAFSFIIMMFNLPLPGGTTAHATGVAIAAIVLGPWASILAVSTALTIQALFFGDGGVTAIGANCFNIAVVGSISAYAVYRVIAAGSPVASPRRVVAAILGGYVSINLAALVTSLELGLQPLLYRDASGAPLYAPYPWAIAIPAIMIGHLLVAGVAEAVVSGGVVAYLQRAEPHLLQPETLAGVREWSSAKALWATLALLAILAPLGLLAVGSAWGEWSLEDFVTPDSRAAIANASGGAALPAQVPAGMDRLAQRWKAPLSDYTVPFFGDERGGYVIAAFTGALLVILLAGAIAFFSRRRSTQESTYFLEKTIAGFLRALEYASSAEQMAASKGLLQKVDPRVKLAGLFGLIVVAATVSRLGVIAALFGVAFFLAILSHLSFVKLAAWVWAPVLLFTGLIALPAMVLTPGDVVAGGGIFSVTASGVRGAAFLILRAETAATLSALLVLTTPWPWVLKALRSLQCPAVLVAILGMAYRYIFVILQNALDILESRRSRTVGPLAATEVRRSMTTAAGVLLSKSVQMSGEVHLAMQARGYRGDVHVLTGFRTRSADWVWLAGFAAVAVFALWLSAGGHA